MMPRWAALLLVPLLGDTDGLRLPRLVRITRLWSGGGDAAQLPTALTAEIDKYMQLRASRESEKQQRVVVVPVSQWRKGRQAPTEPFGIAKASGWFKDEAEIDLRKRSDSSKPYVAHPLSFGELERFGFERLSDDIVKYGGPDLVGRMAGIDWKEPVIELEPEPESSRPVREQMFSLDMRGELSLGGGLEEKLKAAESLDLSKIKMTTQGGQGSRDSDDALAAKRREKVDGPDYSAFRTPSSSSPWQEKGETIPGERFVLDGTQRLFLVFNAAVFSVAYGRTSAEIVASHYWGGIDAAIVDALGTFALGMAAATLFSAVGSGVMAQSQGKNPILGSVLGLLGGPLTLAKLRSASRGSY
jgi:hypothetical protein